jgi:hypothetical protein
MQSSALVSHSGEIAFIEKAISGTDTDGLQAFLGSLLLQVSSDQKRMGQGKATLGRNMELQRGSWTGGPGKGLTGGSLDSRKGLWGSGPIGKEDRIEVVGSGAAALVRAAWPGASKYRLSLWRCKTQLV